MHAAGAAKLGVGHEQAAASNTANFTASEQTLEPQDIEEEMELFEHEFYVLVAS